MHLGKPGCTVIWASMHLGKPGCTVIRAGQGVPASRQTRIYSYLGRTVNPGIKANQDVQLFGRDRASMLLGRMYSYLGRIGHPGI